MVDTLRQNHVEIWFRDTPSGDWPTWLMNLLPLIALFVMWYFMLGQLRRNSRARTEPNAPIEPTGAFGGR
jgi:cytochrome c-type biogenesis protein CcmH/NrfF